MMVVSEMTTSILNRILLVNAKARQGFADINSPYVVIDGKRDRELCERGLCQYIYVMRRCDMKDIRYFDLATDGITFDKVFDLDFFDERVEFFNNVHNSFNLFRRFRFVGYTNEEIIEEDFTEEVSNMAAKGFLNIIGKDDYFLIRPLSVVCIVEPDGTIGVYRCRYK